MESSTFVVGPAFDVRDAVLDAKLLGSEEKQAALAPKIDRGMEAVKSRSPLLMGPTFEEREAALAAKVVAIVFPEKDVMKGIAGAEANPLTIFSSKTAYPTDLAVTVGEGGHRPRVTWGKKPRPPQISAVPKVYSLYSHPHSRAGRPRSIIPKVCPKPGLLPVAYGGKFYAPKESLTGNISTDAKIASILEYFDTISIFLEAKHVSNLAARLVPGGMDEILEAEVKSQVGIYRKEVFRLRKEVVSDKGPHILEPLAYWKKKYYLAMI